MTLAFNVGSWSFEAWISDGKKGDKASGRQPGLASLLEPLRRDGF